MRIVIDGYNVIFAETGRGLKSGSGECEKLRSDLLGRLEPYRMQIDEEITVVFDGGPEGAHLARFQHFGGIEVIFSDPASDADEEIKEFVRASSGARDLRVITDDRELAQAVKRLGAKVAGTAWLLERMNRAEKRAGDEQVKAEPPSKFNGPADFEIDRWVEEFGDLTEEDFEDEDETQ